MGRAKASCNTAVLVVNELGAENLETKVENLRHAGAEEVSGPYLSYTQNQWDARSIF